MISYNNFNGKKKLVAELNAIYKHYIPWIASIELKKYTDGKYEEEFILMTWDNGCISTANNNMNSLTATASNVARMLDGGVYENEELYKRIMESEEWKEID